MILVTGASGNAGRAVLDEVRKSGAAHRAMYRSEEEAKKAPSGTQIAIADFADKQSLRKALDGIDAVYLVCSPIPQLVDFESNVIDASRDAGVKHVVLNSALGAGDYPKSFPAWHRTVEEKLKSSGLGYTIFRPNSFMQNILAFIAPSVRQQGAFYAALDGARISYLDLRDIGAAIAKALNSPKEHAGEIYELNGPEAVTQSELAERISRACGRQVKFVDIPEEAQRKAMLDQGMPEWQVSALLDLQRYYTGGQGGEVTDALPRLLGRAPITLDQFLAEFKDSFSTAA
ncbi:MAG: SDR family oxidoreductase [Acidobacteriaceae bacterium]|nr:SDR family oxidoreductase [Acidobacteriaceae bacterium]